jgi:hypothetical protein
MSIVQVCLGSMNSKRILQSDTIAYVVYLSYEFEQM